MFQHIDFSVTQERLAHKIGTITKRYNVKDHLLGCSVVVLGSWSRGASRTRFRGLCLGLGWSGLGLGLGLGRSGLGLDIKVLLWS